MSKEDGISNAYQPDSTTGFPNQSAKSKPRPILRLGSSSNNRQRGKSWCLPFALAMVALCLLLVVGTVLGITKAVVGFLQPSPPDIYVPTSTTVITQIQTMGKLETVSYTLEKVITYDQDANSFWHFLGDHTKLFVVQGQVIAGIDLSQLRKEDINIQGQDIKTASITLTMPTPQILDASIDENNTRVYDANSGAYGLLGSQVDSDTVVKILGAARNSLRSDACKEGILQQAASSAKTQLTSFLTAIGFQHVEVNTSSGKCS